MPIDFLWPPAGGVVPNPTYPFLLLTGGTLTGGLIGTTLSLSGTLTASGGMTTGSNAFAGVPLAINGAAAATRQVRYQTAGVNRWAVGMSTAAESGANAGADLSISRFSDAGSNIGTAMTITRATGAATFAGGTQTVTTNVIPTFNTSVSLAGTATGNPAFVYSGQTFTIGADTLALPNANQFSDGFQFQHNYGGAGMTGNRQGMQVNLVQAGATSNTIASGNQGFYVGLQTYSIGIANDGGTGLTTGTAHGRQFGGSSAAQLKAGATNYYQCTGWEFNASIDPAASSLIRSMASFAALGTSNQGALVDAAMWVYGSSTALMKTGLLFGGAVNGYPIDPAGTIILANATGGGTAAAAIGIDFSAVAFSTAFLKSTGFQVDGSGAISTTAAGTGLAVTNNATIGGSLTVNGTGTSLTVAHAMSVTGLATLSGGFTGNGVGGVLSGANAFLQVGNGGVRTYSGAASSAQASVLSQEILRGTVASGSQAVNYLWVSDDGAVGPTSNGQIATLQIQHTCTANAVGNRWGIDVNIANSAITAAGAVGLGGIRAQSLPAFNMGGTGTALGTSQGTNFGGNLTAFAQGTATNLRTVTGLEIDVGITAGASAYSKEGLKIVLLSTDATQGAVIDYGFSIQSQVAQASGVGFKTGIVFGGNGGFGVAATGTLMGAFVGVGGMTAALGIDFSGVTFSETPIKVPVLTNAANDAAAAAAGISVGGFYRNGSVVMQRVV